MTKDYLQSFLQATFTAIASIEGSSLEGATLVVGGDGRYFVTQALQILIKMSHANKVRQPSASVAFGSRSVYPVVCVRALTDRYPVASLIRDCQQSH